MIDKCSQYKNDYENLLELKQEFDAFLEEGAKSRSFEEAKRVKTELEKVLRKLEFDLKFKHWKTIVLGTGLKTANDFMRALRRERFEVTGNAEDIIRNSEFTVFSKLTKFELLNISADDLGFPHGTSTEELYKRAQEMGLELCPPEVGPQLCLQHNNQLDREKLIIATEKLIGSNDPRFFDITMRGNWRELGTTYASEGVWSDHCRWVFVRRR